ncbi:MAG: L,D-transpeptidase ErfK/SrfK [Solirubrobacteraceae bacterium]|nr:L,D-transpeptidase ErfK/SrfK [Solirubrobacteraceae bacterium]
MGRATVIGVGAVAAAVVLFVLGVLVIDATRSDVIGDGVRIGNVAVGGLDRAAARERVQRALGNDHGEPVSATYGRQRFVLTPEVAKERFDADASVDAALRRSRTGNPFSRVLSGVDASGTVTPRMAFSRPAVQDFAARVAARVDRAPRDADINWHDGKLQRTHARNGVRTRRPQLLAALVGRVSTAGASRTIAVPVTVTARPDRTLTDIAKRYPTVIAVDRDSKQLRLYKLLKLEHRYPIAVGRAGLETAAGRYKIQDKVVNPPWHVPQSSWAGDLAGKTIPAGDPQNPLEARWMGFHDGQGIHGTNDIASLGTAASHGCIRMSVPDVEQLFRQVKVGTPVFLQ